MLLKMGLSITMHDDVLDTDGETLACDRSSGPFLQQYCAEKNLSPESFEWHLVKRVIFVHFLLVLPILWIFGTNVLHPERRLLTLIGRCQSLEEVQNNIDFYQHKNVVNSLWRGPLRFRISGKKLMRIAKSLSLRDR